MSSSLVSLQVHESDVHQPVVRRRQSEVERLVEEEVLENEEDFGMDVDKRNGVEKMRFLIPVHHPYRGYWDVVIIVSLIFTATVTPFEVAFLPAVFSALFVINRFVDAIFLSDMVLTLMTPVMDEDKGVWIFSHWGIFLKYARFWFWIDLLTVIPFDAISLAIEAENPGGSNLQGIRLLRLLRLIKLARVVRASRIIKRREMEMEMKYSTLTVIKLVIIIIMLMHWTSCLMALVPQLDGQSYDYLNATQIENGEKPFNWIVYYFERVLLENYGDYDIWSVYLAGCYFAAMTLTTIGYGDVTPKTDAERGVVIIIMLGGATFYAYAVGNICSIVQDSDKVKSQFKQECDDFANFLDAQKFPYEMKQRLKKYIHFTWTKRKAIYHRELLGNLSDALQKEIAFELSKKWVSLIPFLNEAITPLKSGEFDDLIQEISLKLLPEAYPAQETLIRRGDVVDRLFVIERGTAFAHPFDLREKAAGAKTTLTFDSNVEVAKCFGMEMLVDNYISPLFVTCATDVDALVLTKADLFEVLERFPVTKANIHYLSSRKNYDQFKSKMVHGDAVKAFDPEESEQEVVNQIIQLNHEIKDLSTALYKLEENLAIRVELLKVAKGE